MLAIVIAGLLTAALSGPASAQPRLPEDADRSTRATIDSLQSVVQELRAVVQSLRESKPGAPSRRAAFLVPSVTPSCAGASGATCNSRLLATEYCRSIGYANGLDHDVRTLGAGRVTFGAVCFDP